MTSIHDENWRCAYARHRIVWSHTIWTQDAPIWSLVCIWCALFTKQTTAAHQVGGAKSEVGFFKSVRHENRREDRIAKWSAWKIHESRCIISGWTGNPWSFHQGNDRHCVAIWSPFGCFQLQANVYVWMVIKLKSGFLCSVSMRIREDLGPCPQLRIFAVGLDTPARLITYTVAHQDRIVDFIVESRDRSRVIMRRRDRVSYSLFDNWSWLFYNRSDEDKRTLGKTKSEPTIHGCAHVLQRSSLLFRVLLWPRVWPCALVRKYASFAYNPGTHL